MRKRSLAALCTVTALGVVLTIPATAQAADPHPSGFRSWTDQTRLYLDFGTQQPKDLKVHLRKTGTDTPVATVTSFEYMEDEDPCSPSCQDDPGFWGIQSAPLRLADLGQYSLDVEYDDTLGETILHKNKATLDYRLIPRVTAFEVVGRPHLENRTVTIKADAVARDPRNDTDQPLANGKLVLDTPGAATPMVTDAAGHLETPFTFTGTEQLNIARLMVKLRPEDRDRLPEHGQEREVDIAGFPTPKITLDSAKVVGPDGSKAPVSGRVTFVGGDGTPKPVPVGTALRHDTAGEFKTGENGRFTTQVLINGTRPGRISLSNSVWMAAGATPVVVDPSTSAGFHEQTTTSVSADKKVTVTAKIDRYDIPAPVKLKVLAEFRPYGAPDWTTKATVDSGAPAGTSTALVTTTLPYPGPGDWRLRYAGAVQIPAGPASGSAFAGRGMTAIPEFNATPEPVKAGRPITITGRLTQKWYSKPNWTGHGDQPVRIYFRATGTTTWKLTGTTTTRADGTFKRAFTAGKDGTWKARYEPATPYYFNAASREDLVDVR